MGSWGLPLPVISNQERIPPNQTIAFEIRLVTRKLNQRISVWKLRKKRNLSVQA